MEIRGAGMPVRCKVKTYKKALTYADFRRQTTSVKNQSFLWQHKRFTAKMSEACEGRRKRLTSSQRIQTSSETHPASYSSRNGRWVWGWGWGFFEVVQRPQREADHLPPSSGEVMNDWRYTSTLLHSFTALPGTILPVLPTLKKVVLYFNVQA
jgi:hypothetical protein